ncbi:hypothetical protein ES705_15510 [subsurface metagenome]
MTSTNQQEPLNDNDHPLFLSYGFLWGMFIAYIIALSVAIYINIKNSFFVNDPGYIELATSLLGVFAMYTLFNAIFVYVTYRKRKLQKMIRKDGKIIKDGSKAVRFALNKNYIKILYFLLVSISLVLSISGFILPTLIRDYGLSVSYIWSFGLFINISFDPVVGDALIMPDPLMWIAFPYQMIAFILILRAENDIIQILRKKKDLSNRVCTWGKLGLIILFYNSMFFLGNFFINWNYLDVSYIPLVVGPLLIVAYIIWILTSKKNKI